MNESVTLFINEKEITVPAGVTVSAAIAMTKTITYRRSVSGESRAPLCGMGICFECCVTIDNRKHVRSCKTICADGMDIRTDD